jgi:cytochrome P450
MTPPVFAPDAPPWRSAPHALYRQLLEHGAAFRNPDGTWVVSRHQDVWALLRNRDSLIKQPEKTLRTFPPGPFRDHNGATLAFMDPPRHTRVRTVLAGAFTTGAIETVSAAIEMIVDDLLDGLAQRHDFDAVYDFARALPLEVIRLLLDAPPTDRGVLEAAADRVVEALEPGAGAAAAERAAAALARLRAVIEPRLAAPHPTATAPLDILGRAKAAGEITHDEAIHQAMFLLNAGHETTASLIGSAILALMEAPEALARFRHEPDLHANTVDEMLRLFPPLHFTFRRVAQEISVTGGVLAPGDAVILVIAAANRDPSVFSDPDRLDPARANANRHLAFAAGAHTCLGANLARLETRIGLARFFARFATVEPAGAPVPNDGLIFRGLRSLPVRTSGHA